MVKQIYWDFFATSPCRSEVLLAMQEFWEESFGNPASTHLAGRRAKKAVDQARQQVAQLLNCEDHEIVFTSGATESNNLVFLGLLLTGADKRNKIAVSAIEHKSVLEPAKKLAMHGFELVILPVNRQGFVLLEEAERMIDDKTALVSVQVANNEIGTIQPVGRLAALAHVQGAFFHTDAAQALGKMPLDLVDIDCDFASFSAHKVYGPKGVGALYTRGGPARWPFEKPFGGGGQEAGLRPGTINVPGVVGFGEACKYIANHLEADIEKLRKHSSLFAFLVKQKIPQVVINNLHENILPGILSVSFPGLPNDVLMSHLSNYCFSGGAACQSGAIGGSHVLSQIVNTELIDNTVRLSFGSHTNESDMSNFIDTVKLLLERMSEHEGNF